MEGTDESSKSNRPERTNHMHSDYLFFSHIAGTEQPDGVVPMEAPAAADSNVVGRSGYEHLTVSPSIFEVELCSERNNNNNNNNKPSKARSINKQLQRHLKSHLWAGTVCEEDDDTSSDGILWMKGDVHWCMLFPNGEPLKKVKVQLRISGQLTHIFSLTQLPTTLTYLDLQLSTFVMTSWRALSELTALSTLWLPNNSFSESAAGDAVDYFSMLPRTLTRFSILSCKFAPGAAADLSSLPPGIDKLHIGKTSNLTLHCSDIGLFSVFSLFKVKLDDFSKQQLSELTVVLGAIGDDDHAGAERVSGKELLERVVVAREATGREYIEHEAAAAVAATQRHGRCLAELRGRMCVEQEAALDLDRLETAVRAVADEAVAAAMAGAAPVTLWKGHWLENMQRTREWRCDGCHTSLPASDISACCQTCSYHLCKRCVETRKALSGATCKDQQHQQRRETTSLVVPALRLPSSISQSRDATCKSGHLLRDTQRHRGWWCDGCGNKHLSEQTSWWCEPCDYALCSPCYTDANKQSDSGAPAAAAAAAAEAGAHYTSRSIVSADGSDGDPYGPGPVTESAATVPSSGAAVVVAQQQQQALHKELQSKIDELRQERDVTADELCSAKAALAAAKAARPEAAEQWVDDARQLALTAAELSEVRQKQQQLAATLDATEQQLTDANSRLQQSRAECAAAAQQIDELHEKQHQLQQELEHLERDKRQQERRVLETSHLTARLAAALAERRRLRRSLADMRKSCATLRLVIRQSEANKKMMKKKKQKLGMMLQRKVAKALATSKQEERMLNDRVVELERFLGAMRHRTDSPPESAVNHSSSNNNNSTNNNNNNGSVPTTVAAHLRSDGSSSVSSGAADRNAGGDEDAGLSSDEIERRNRDFEARRDQVESRERDLLAADAAQQLLTSGSTVYGD